MTYYRLVACGDRVYVAQPLLAPSPPDLRGFMTYVSKLAEILRDRFEDVQPVLTPADLVFVGLLRCAPQSFLLTLEHTTSKVASLVMRCVACILHRHSVLDAIGCDSSLQKPSVPCYDDEDRFDPAHSLLREFLRSDVVETRDGTSMTVDELRRRSGACLAAMAMSQSSKAFVEESFATPIRSGGMWNDFAVAVALCELYDIEIHLWDPLQPYQRPRTVITALDDDGSRGVRRAVHFYCVEIVARSIYWFALVPAVLRITVARTSSAEKLWND